jgi:acylglycerol lipase
MPTSSVKTSREMIKAVECEDGYRLQFRAWPAQAPALATLVLINGAMSHSGWFRHLAQSLSAANIKVVGADRRGSGLNSEDRGDARSRHLLLSDLRRIIEAEGNGLPVYVAGWCWGALLAVNAALEFGDVLKGLVLLAPGLFPSETIKGNMRSNARALESTGARSSAIATPLTEEMFTDVPCFRDFIRNDDHAVRTFTPQFMRISQTMLLVATARLAQLKLPVLLLLAAQDQTVDNQLTLTKFQQLKTAEVTSAMLPYNHGMQFEGPEEIARRITEWLERQRVRVPGPQNFL